MKNGINDDQELNSFTIPINISYFVENMIICYIECQILQICICLTNTRFE